MSKEGKDEADASYPPTNTRAEFLMSRNPVPDSNGGNSYWVTLYTFTLHGSVRYANTKNLFVKPVGNGFEDTKDRVAKLALNFLYSGIKTDIYHMKEAETIIHDIINSSTIETE